MIRSLRGQRQLD